MNKSLKIGLGFGVASSVITTLGLMIGLYSSTNSRGIVLAGILTIAITEAFSDAFGIHFSEEVNGNNQKDIWLATFYTYIFKFIVSITFLFPVLMLPLGLSIITNIIWGFLLIGVFSYIVAVKQKQNPLQAVLEHFMIIIIVVLITFYLGKVIDQMFID
jgi:vacuolar iron transporter family protein